MPLFKDIIYDGIRAGKMPARNRTSRRWFRRAAKELTGHMTLKTAAKGLPAKRRVDRPAPGYMYLFRYDPKHKKTLPYYDSYPLIFPVASYDDGFSGINFHYLPPPLRAQLMDALYSVKTDRRYDENTKILLTYKILNGVSKFKNFAPTYKRYLYAHVRSKFLEIQSVEWDIALFLPTEKFNKASSAEVWKDSRSKV
jgi:hypothetical protein